MVGMDCKRKQVEEGFVALGRQKKSNSSTPVGPYEAVWFEATILRYKERIVKWKAPPHPPIPLKEGKKEEM